MDSDTIKNDLLNTLNVLKVDEAPTLVEQVIHYFISSNKETPVTHAEIISELKDLENKGQIFTNTEGFVSNSKIDPSTMRIKLQLEESTREKAKFSIKILKFLSRVSFIKYIGIVGDAPFGRIRRNEEIGLIIIVSKDTQYLAKFIIEKYLSLKFVSKKFKIDRIFEIGNLKWKPDDAQNGIKLLNITTLINKNKAYENLMAANSWIFEIFSNYPLEKVSWGFRVSKNKGKEAPKLYKKLNSILGPKP